MLVQFLKKDCFSFLEAWASFPLLLCVPNWFRPTHLWINIWQGWQNYSEWWGGRGGREEGRREEWREGERGIERASDKRTLVWHLQEGPALEAGLALTVRPHCSPAGHKPSHRTPTTQERSLWDSGKVRQDKATWQKSKYLTKTRLPYKPQNTNALLLWLRWVTAAAHELLL